ncbi:MAG: DUF1194 domain-containing protein [Pseudomonadota bacterium]
MNVTFASALTLVFSLLVTAGHAQCRQALALALDVSGSVDEREYRLQVLGLAQALDASAVRGRLLAMPSAPVRLLVYEWSGPADQTLLVPWTEVSDDTSIDIIIETLQQVIRSDATPGTALGIAMQEGARYLDQQRDCWKRTLDISGDGKANMGPRPRDVRNRLARSGITVNGLVVGVDDPNIGDVRQAEIGELSSYYRTQVILGQDAFVQTAIGYADFARAMEAKLMRELDGLVFSQNAATRLKRD